MRKILTNGDLIEILKRFPPDAVSVICDEGKGHYAPLLENEIFIIESAYFSRSYTTDELENAGWVFGPHYELIEEPKFLNLGWI